MVPFEAVEVYKSDSEWGRFKHIQGFDPSGVENVETDKVIKSIVGRYDLNGNPVDENYKGIVIIRFSDGSTEKVAC